LSLQEREKKNPGAVGGAVLGLVASKALSQNPVLTQGSALGPGDYFGGPQDKFPNGGLEIGQGPARGTNV